MVSDKPQPGRCGAKCRDRVGIEVYSTDVNSSVPWTEEEIERMWMVDQEEAEEPGKLERVEVEPEYQEAREYRWEDWVVSDIELDDGERLRFRPDDDDWPPYMKWSTMEVQGHCEKFPSRATDSSRCYIHDGPEDSFDEEDRSRGGKNSSGGNAMKHGLYAQRGNYYQSVSNEDKRWIDGMVDSWVENAPFTRDNDAKVNKLFQVAVDEHKMWRANNYFAEDENDLVEYEPSYDAEGNYVGDEAVESPMNLVYDRMARTNMTMLKDLGVLEDPESQQAEATESLAQKLSGGGE